MSEVCQLIAERQATHGEFEQVAAIAQGIKELLRLGASWEAMGPQLNEVAEMIATKLARFVCGDPGHPDHLKDIAGYADRGLASIGAAWGGSLSFATLVTVSLSRSRRWHKDGVHCWSPTDWAISLVGEAGEMCNAINKLRRIEDDAENRHRLDIREAAISAIGEELADTILFAPMLAARLGIDLEAALVAKFNKTSERYGFPERLGEPFAAVTP